MKLTKKYCTSRKATKYPTPNDAKIACYQDKECSTIVDFKCDDRFYYHCKKTSSIKYSVSSCVYSKVGEEGNISINQVNNQ